MRNKAAARETRLRHQKQSHGTKNKAAAPKTRLWQHGTKNKAVATWHQKQGCGNTTQTTMPQQHHPNCHTAATPPKLPHHSNPHQPHAATIPTNLMPWQHHPKAPCRGNTTQTTTPWKPPPPPHRDNTIPPPPAAEPTAAPTIHQPQHPQKPPPTAPRKPPPAAPTIHQPQCQENHRLQHLQQKQTMSVPPTMTTRARKNGNESKKKWR